MADRNRPVPLAAKLAQLRTMWSRAAGAAVGLKAAGGQALDSGTDAEATRLYKAVADFLRRDSNEVKVRLADIKRPVEPAGLAEYLDRLEHLHMSLQGQEGCSVEAAQVEREVDAMLKRFTRAVAWEKHALRVQSGRARRSARMEPRAVEATANELAERLDRATEGLIPTPEGAPGAFSRSVESVLSNEPDPTLLRTGRSLTELAAPGRYAELAEARRDQTDPSAGVIPGMDLMAGPASQDVIELGRTRVVTPTELADLDPAEPAGALPRDPMQLPAQIPPREPLLLLPGPQEFADNALGDMFDPPDPPPPPEPRDPGRNL